MTDLSKNDRESWLEFIWHALECYREDCIPEDQEEHYDKEWSNICTAMAWIRELLFAETGTADEEKTIVSVSFDLDQSIECRGYKRPDEDTLANMKKAFENWLWYEIEEHWNAIVEPAGFDFEQEADND